MDTSAGGRGEFEGGGGGGAREAKPSTPQGGGQSNGQSTAADSQSAGGRQSTLPSAPSISLPKGGGAIQGIGEKFSVNLATGTAAFNIPILTTPGGRQNMRPQISLSYDSGAGNGPFGIGWQLSGAMGSITRKTARGLPLYDDANDSDVFLLGGAEDLVPLFKKTGDGEVIRNDRGQPEFEEKTVDTYTVRQYAPRITQDWTRIERWTSLSDPSDVHWRLLTPKNETTIYGADGHSRVHNQSQPGSGEPLKILTWLESERYDAYGNAMAFVYKSENSEKVAVASAHEANRTETSRMANRYIKRIRFGNTAPNRDIDTWKPLSAFGLADDQWKFSVVFDYGEHSQLNPSADDSDSGQQWPCRADPFSTYQGGFEVRTYRLCRRVLVFHHFDELGARDYLVRSTDLEYVEQRTCSYLASLAHAGYRMNEDRESYHREILPPLTMKYELFPTDEELGEMLVQTVDRSSLENLPAGLDQTNYRWVDLDGEGLSGVLTEQGDSWYYKRNTSANNMKPQDPSAPPTLEDDNSTSEGGSAKVSARFGPLEMVSSRPSMSLTDGMAYFSDVQGDGKLELVTAGPALWGYYERTDEAGWEAFKPFETHPNLNMINTDTKMVDLTGDGLPDILSTANQMLYWYVSRAAAGYGPAAPIPLAPSEEEGPLFVAGDAKQAIFFADMSGDGLADVVRVSNEEVCYWPNLGYCRWGQKVQMDNAPRFDHCDVFTAKMVRLADIDGSGAADIIYLGSDGVDIYLNQSGNGFADKKELRSFPPVHDQAAVDTIDLLGSGTICLVWSSPLEVFSERPMQYVDLTLGRKPHLLTKVINNLGSETVVKYAPSTKFYLNDKHAGRPWLTKLPFPVHCVERVETFDQVSKNKFAQQYSYHHGYFDAVEREFRGFGFCEEWDTDRFAAISDSSGDAGGGAATNVNASWHVPPVHTKSWFHTGAYTVSEYVSQHMALEYFGAPKDPNDSQARAKFYDTLLPDTVAPAKGLDPAALAEACRALKGRALRTEVYADDGTAKELIPYTVEEVNYTIDVVQGVQDAHQYSVFGVHPREMIKYNYERNTEDPRVDHTMALEVDTFGNVKKQVKIAYGRKAATTPLQGRDADKQKETWLVYSEHDFTEPLSEPKDYRTPVNCEAREYEISGIIPKEGTWRYSISDFSGDDFQPVRDLPELAYERRRGIGEAGKRMVGRFQTFWRKDDFTGLSPLGQVQSLGIPGEEYDLCFTPGLLESVFKRPAVITDPREMLGNAGSYVDHEANGSWWKPSGRVYFHADRSVSPTEELAEARRSFFQPQSFISPYGTQNRVAYDDFYFFPVKTVDSVDNIKTTVIDYRVLASWMVTDQNGNRSMAAFNVLGVSVGSATMGKGSGQGDSLDDFHPDLSDEDLDEFLRDPKSKAADILGTASARVVYDARRYWRNEGRNKLPSFVATISRETHQADLAQNAKTRTRVSIAYSDGFGRTIQSKGQAKAGPLVEDGEDGGPVVQDRWKTSGWTIYNNKGMAVRTYEPFFDDTHLYKFNSTVGVSPIVMYDPLMRAVATLNPDHTFTKIIFDSWSETHYDVCDTVLTSRPESDRHVGQYFKLLPESDYLPSWHDSRVNGQLGPDEEAAAIAAAAHDDTPQTKHLDAMGRAILTTLDAGNDVKIDHRATFDIEGQVYEEEDALGRIYSRKVYSITGEQIHHASMDAGERWSLMDVSGNPIYTWNSRAIRHRTVYDNVRRVVEEWVREGEEGAEILAEKNLYGEVAPDNTALNLRGEQWTIMDQAGKSVSAEFDFKGNLVRGEQTLAREYRDIIDWTNQVDMEDETFLFAASHDAMSRTVRIVMHDNTTTVRTFDDSGLVDKIYINIRGEQTSPDPSTWTPIMTDVRHNAKDQVTAMSHGNGTKSVRTYDKETFRLESIRTVRPMAAGGGEEAVQDLHYTYDPMGNVARVRDDAQQAIFFRNNRITPTWNYTYDSIYRLVTASGREHLGQMNGQPNAPQAPGPYGRDSESPSDGNAIGSYTERYEYDRAGNIRSVAHAGDDPRHQGWTRTYAYDLPSLIDPSDKSNRLSSTTVNDSTAVYKYEGSPGAVGNITSLPHLPRMEWDLWDRLKETASQLVVADGASPETTYYRYNSAGSRLRKVTVSEAGTDGGPVTPRRTKERIYVAGGDVFRRYSGDGNTVTAERVTTAVTGEGGKLALIETRSRGGDQESQRLLRFQLDSLLGSVAVELDDQARLISYEEFFPYGASAYRAVASATEAPKRYHLHGKERDDETGLDYYGARYYAAWIGRWISPEPGGEGPDGPNLYQFVKSNPVSSKDDDGHMTVGPSTNPVPGPRPPPPPFTIPPEPPPSIPPEGPIFLEREVGKQVVRETAKRTALRGLARAVGGAILRGLAAVPGWGWAIIVLVLVVILIVVLMNRDPVIAPGPGPSVPKEAPGQRNPDEHPIEQPGEPLHLPPPEGTPSEPVGDPDTDPEVRETQDDKAADSWARREKRMRLERDKDNSRKKTRDPIDHHLMPKTDEFAWFFRRAGIDVHLREYLRRMPTKHHNLIHGPYLAEWKKWILENTDWTNKKIPSRQRILNFMRKMDKKYLTDQYPHPPEDYKRMGPYFKGPTPKFPTKSQFKKHQNVK